MGQPKNEDLFVGDKEKGAATRGARETAPVSRTTIHRYRKMGFDVGPPGKPDYKKIAAIHEQQQKKGKEGDLFNEQSQYWNDRYRKARALDMERQLAVSLGRLVEVQKVEEEAFELWRNYRDTWLNVPAKWAGEAAAELGLDAEKGQEQMFLMLTKIVEKTLEEFANGPSHSGRLSEGRAGGDAA